MKEKARKMKTITIEEVLEKKAEEAVIVDIRPEESFPGAVPWKVPSIYPEKR